MAKSKEKMAEPKRMKIKVDDDTELAKAAELSESEKEALRK